jgi:hypothetical protein
MLVVRWESGSNGRINWICIKSYVLRFDCTRICGFSGRSIISTVCIVLVIVLCGYDATLIPPRDAVYLQSGIRAIY